MAEIRYWKRISQKSIFWGIAHLVRVCQAAGLPTGVAGESGQGQFFRPAFVVPVFLLLSFFFLALSSARHLSATYDEPLHIASGVVHWRYGDTMLDPANPPLLGDWFTLPLLPLNLRLPPGGRQGYEGHRYTFAFRFLHDNSVSVGRLLFLTRFMNVLLGVVLGCLLWRWVSHRLGTTAAVAALIAYSFCPMLLAHGALATCDIGFSFAALLCGYTAWRWTRDPAPSTALGVGISLGMALAAKYSAILLIPLFAVTVGLQRTIETFETRSLRQWWLQGVLFVASVWGVLALCYRGWGWPSYLAGWQALLPYVREGHLNFFWSHYSDRGWIAYFWTAFLLKTPLPFLFLCLIGLFLVVRRGDDPACRFALLWGLFPALGYLTVVSFSSIQVGLRHALVVYPWFCIWIGWVVQALWSSRRRMARIGVIALGFWYVAVTLLFYPRYLSYFNELAGGAAGGSRYFLDSNLDWGQGLKALGTYLQKETVAGSIYLSYFGCADPRAYGIRYVPLAMTSCTELAGEPQADPSQEKQILLAISETNLGGVYYQPHDVFRWLNQRQPVRVLLDSIRIYDITQDADAQKRLKALQKSQNL